MLLAPALLMHGGKTHHENLKKLLATLDIGSHSSNAGGELRAKRASGLAVSSSAVLDAAQRLHLTRTLPGILELDRLDT
jgi:hypothetical protein